MTNTNTRPCSCIEILADKPTQALPHGRLLACIPLPLMIGEVSEMDSVGINEPGDLLLRIEKRIGHRHATSIILERHAEAEISRHKPGLWSCASSKTSSLLAVRKCRSWESRFRSACSESHLQCNRPGGAVKSEAPTHCVSTASHKRASTGRLRMLPTIDVR
jgi:hypothetical protein